MRRLACFLALVATGCSVVKASMVRPDWPQEDQKKVKRLAVYVQPLPDGNEKAGEMVARVARRYVNQKREFLVKKEVVDANAPQLATLCGGDDAIEGVLVLHLTLQKNGAGFEASLDGSLQRCPDGREAWSAHAAGSFNSKDPGLAEVTGVYVREIGPEVEPYVAPTMNLLRPALDTLPQPVLTDDDVTEKMSLD